MGCLPCKFLRRNNHIRSVRQAGEDSPNAHELGTVTSLAPDPLEEIENDVNVTRVEEEIIGNNSKIPGTIDDGHKDETSPLLAPSTSQSNIPASSLSLEQTEEDLQNAAILQAVVRAYIMRKNKLKEENTPFSELMVTTPSFNTFGLDDEPSLLIPQVPTFRSQLQQPPSNPMNQSSYAIPPPPQPQQSLFSSSSSVYPPHPSQTNVYPHSQPFQVPYLHQDMSPPLPQAPLRTPTKPLLANTLRHALSASDA